MASPSRAEVFEALREVEERFPFSDYITLGEKYSMAHVIDRIGPHLNWSGERVLDIGCGPMDKTALLQQLGLSCYAVDDLSDGWHTRDDNRRRMIEFSKTCGINFHLQKEGDYAVPFEEASFDLVTMFMIIEHLHESPREILNTAGRFAKPGGLICFTVPNFVNLRKRIDVLRGRSNHMPIQYLYHAPGQWRGHVHEYTVSEARYICEASGFEVISVSTMEGEAYNKLPRMLLPVYQAITQLMPALRTHICVLARRPEGWAPAEPDEIAYLTAMESVAPKGVR